MLNSPEIHSDMTISEFVALRDLIRDIDIWSLSQTLFNTALNLESAETFEREPSQPESLLEQLQQNLQPRKDNRNVTKEESESTT